MEQRHREFRRVMRMHYSPAEYGILVHHYHTAAQAIEALGSCTFLQVFLDHDLSEDDIMAVVDGPTSVPTGMAVVDHICAMDSPPNEVIVHSCNGPAAEEMVARLTVAHGDKPYFSVRRIPFPSLIPALTPRD